MQSRRAGLLADSHNEADAEPLEQEKRPKRWRKPVKLPPIGSPPPRSAATLPEPDEQIVNVGELRALTGCSGATIETFAKRGMIPVAGYDRTGQPLFDTSDPKLAEWIKALQGAGYHRAPAAEQPA